MEEKSKQFVAKGAAVYAQALIVLPAPAAASRGRPPGGGSPPHLPGRTRQGQRLGPRFETLRAHFEQRTVELRASAAGQIPEEVIVFETVGSVANFLNAARLVPGLDFLAEWDVEDIAPDDDFYKEGKADEHLDRIRRVVTRLRGQVVSVCELDAICYLAAVVTLPSSKIRRLVDRKEVELLGDSSVRFFRPSGQSVMPGHGQPDLQEPIPPQPAAMPSGDATVALLDGLPLENHVRLAGRLRVDDPDGYASDYTASERDHGTTIASIILHGDLNAPRPPLSRPFYVRPILRPDPQPWKIARDEPIPFGINPLDLTHRAVRRLFEADGATPPTAPTIKALNTRCRVQLTVSAGEPGVKRSAI